MKLIATLLATIALVGCASPQQYKAIINDDVPRLTWKEVQNFRVTCANAADQAAFLKKQLVSGYLKSTMWDTYETGYAMKQNEYNANLKMLIRQAEELAYFERVDPQRKAHTCPDYLYRGE